MSDRDRKLLLGLVPVVLLAVFWFLLFSPKREAAAEAKTELAQQQERLDAAKAAVSQANTSKTSFAADYGEIVRLGKAIPAQVDMPSLLLQLDGAARGTGIHFTKITAGARESAVPAAPAATGTDSGSTSSASSSASSSSSSSSAPPVAAGGQTAQSAPGGATEAANNAAATSNNQAAAASGVNPADAQTSTSSRQGGLPVGGGATTGGAATAAPAPAGLDTVPLELEFTGDFFHLANFFHQVKRFVHVVNNNVVVNGRLLTIQSVNYSSSAEMFPAMKAELTATVYLTPKAEGVTAGATPAGPAAPSTTPASAPAPSSTPAPPTAAATP
ncbi:MAG TPA: type II secretion system protein GspM [Thermoleophilaceae bacterium]|nr:type II secretion system protein GspM [Thermoleophilaceae bacterium]